VPVESIAAVERSIADFNKTQQDKVGWYTETVVALGCMGGGCNTL
jgi:hypothetical protein